MYHPFQRIANVQHDGSAFLLAAAGPILSSINLQDGTIASRWSSASQEESAVDETSQDGYEIQDHPKKRRRIELEKPGANIIEVQPTPDGKHAVVVTGEDKCVHVFLISADGALRYLSQRCMPKRPSALTLIDEGSTIVIADKFGDVYAMPLLPTEEQEVAAKEAAKQRAKPLRVMASETTVHSKANLKSLEFQRKQAGDSVPIKTNETMGFAHDYLLGHVSMITDIVATKIPTDSSSNNKRIHILTSDRDEHIRISRGPPQCFVIERYCLGHKEFISKMCLIAPDILVSGGGDDSLFVWKISDGSLLSQIRLGAAIAQATQAPETDVRLAVSGLWSLASEGYPHLLLIGLEGQPSLFYCDMSVTESVGVSKVKHLPLSANLLDLTIVDDFVFVSLDNIHVSGSTEEVDTATQQKRRLHVIDLHRTREEDLTKLQARLVEANEIITAEWHEKDLQTLLYSVANLRKLHDDSTNAEAVESEAN